MYAEELLFAPKYARAKRLIGEGALGEVYMVKQSKCHFGPHSEWFWDVNRTGGIDDRAENYGTHGLTIADLIRGNALTTFSDTGYGYAVERAPETKGWTFTGFEEMWNYGFPQDLQHFVDCVANDEQPLETGEDGRLVLEVLCAAYQSARLGQKVSLREPFQTPASKPIGLWLGAS